MADMQWLTHADFADRVDEVFEVPDAGLDLVLVETTESAEPAGPGPDGRSRNQFSLVFTGPLDRTITQGTVRVVHVDLGEQHLFLVPLGPQDDAMRYEAAFA